MKELAILKVDASIAPHPMRWFVSKYKKKSHIHKKPFHGNLTVRLFVSKYKKILHFHQKPFHGI
ncbi:hypothetical protein LguiA_021138 [Lonicera macranthoides]